MSTLMDYGPDYPPAAAAAEPFIDWRRLAQRCINAIAIYCAIAGLGLFALSVREATQVRHLTAPTQPHGTYRMTIVTPSPDVTGVTATLPPHPATHRSNP